MYAIVGLGNPGSRYAHTRHNVGHMVASEIVERAGAKLSAHRPSHTHAASVQIGPPPSDKAIVAVCDSFMNTSGGPVKSLLSYFSIPVEKLIVIHDDLDLPFGALKMKRGGGEGGHNGLKSISAALGTKNYMRLRFGIGRPHPSEDPANFVLARFSRSEQPTLEKGISILAQAAQDVILDGFASAQMRLHSHH